MIYREDKDRGFSLVEVTLALGVAAFCLIAVFGLLPVGVQTNQRAISQTAATSILSNVIADLRATPSNAPTSTLYQINFGQARPYWFNGNGQVTTVTDPDARYRLYVTFPANPAGPNAATFVYLLITWPAAVDPALGTPGGTSEMFAAFTRN